jgi:APA family basic amino acid/polyamine antiporter
MPIGILGSLAICTVLYILFAHVMTGVTSYTSFRGKDGIAPVAVAIEHMGKADASGLIHPDYPWLNRAIIVAILAGYSSVILVMLLGQSRVFFSMSKDGLIPRVFSEIHPKFRTPAKSNLLFLVFVSLFAAFVPARVVGEMTSIGTLFAFILVCIGVLILRRKMPEAPRAFRTPLVPLIPLLGVATCFFMMAFLPLDTWIRLIVWMLIGFDVYLWYGVKKSLLSSGMPGTVQQSNKVVGGSGLVLAIVLAAVAFLHHEQTDGADTGLFYFSLAFAALHLIVFGMRIAKK